MGSSLGPVLANIIMTELERVIVEPLITSGKIKFHIRYVDTLLLVKEECLSFISSIHFMKILKETQTLKA